MTGMIERQAAIDAVRRTPYHDLIKENMVALLMNLPSAELKHGRWIEFSPKAIYECSLCHKYVATADIEADHFCPYCGAKMEADHE
jgi:rRNA maturation endonuclease Nob1